MLPRRLEAAPDGKWACGEQIDKFRGPLYAFVSSWTEMTHAYKLKGTSVFHSIFFRSKVFYGFIESLSTKVAATTSAFIDSRAWIGAGVEGEEADDDYTADDDASNSGQELQAVAMNEDDTHPSTLTKH